MTTDTDTALQEAFVLFAQEPLPSARRIRELFRTDPRNFQNVIAHCGSYDPQNRGLRYALSLLRHDDLLVPALADPAQTSFSQAVNLTRCMLEIDDDFANELLDAAIDRFHPIGDTIRQSRILDLIAECPENVTHWRAVSQLYAEAEGKIKKQCASLLVRSRSTSRGVAARFARVRANMVETLCNHERGEAEELLQVAVSDPSNRVAGNAYFALYRLGDVTALRGLSDMLARPELPFRITAAWAMGQTRDPRFEKPLAEAARSTDTLLRKNALRSLVRLSRLDHNNPDTCIRPSLIPAVPVARTSSEILDRQIWLRVLNRQGQHVSGLRPLDFHVFQAKEPILEYSIEQIVNPGSVSLRVVFPATVAHEVSPAIIASLKSKPACQAWSIAEVDAAQSDFAPKFMQDDKEITSVLSGRSPKAATVTQACRGLLNLESPAKDNHLLILLDSELFNDLSLDELEDACRSGNVQLHVYGLTSSAVAASMPNFCIPILSNETFASWWGQFSASLSNRYTLRFTGNIDDLEVVVRQSHNSNKPISSKKAL